MNLYRLGYAESTILFMYYLTNIINVMTMEDPLIEAYHWLIPHLYYSSGFYDKTFEKTDIDTNTNEIISIHHWISLHKKNSMRMFNSECFQLYLKTILKILHKCDTLDLNLYNYNNELDNYKEGFIAFFNSKNIFGYSYCKMNELLLRDDIQNTLYSFILNKNILIINPMSELMKNQYDSGNLHKISTSFPIVNSIITYKMPYTFYNNGPDHSIHETVKKINEDINHLSFDCAIISAGAYSCLIAHHIDNMNKPTLIIGSHLLYLFGIITGRSKACQFTFPNEEYWLNVPEEYKPKSYKNIEGGCYW